MNTTELRAIVGNIDPALYAELEGRGVTDLLITHHRPIEYSTDEGKTWQPYGDEDEELFTPRNLRDLRDNPHEAALIRFTSRGGGTIVSLELSNGERATGASGCHVEDNFCKRTGRELALRRALDRATGVGRTDPADEGRLPEPMKLMDTDEFVEFGYLQELNRSFLHPLGLALVVGSGLVGIWDCREDIEGIVFGDGVLDADKAARVTAEWEARRSNRETVLGFMVQPVAVGWDRDEERPPPQHHGGPPAPRQARIVQIEGESFLEYPGSMADLAEADVVISGSGRLLKNRWGVEGLQAPADYLLMAEKLPGRCENRRVTPEVNREERPFASTPPPLAYESLEDTEADIHVEEDLGWAWRVSEWLADRWGRIRG